MEVAVAAQLARGLTLGVAESLTGGLIASRLVNVAGASAWFRGGVVAYDSQVKFDVLGVPVGPVVSEAAAAAMAEGAAGSPGPTSAWASPAWPAPTSRRAWPRARCSSASTSPAAGPTRELHLPGDRERVRQYGAISALDLLRRALIELTA
jgi:nicotinamide-nucleotide amidase